MELDEALDIAMGGYDKREKFVPFNQAESMSSVVVLYLEDVPIGCGAYRRYNDTTAEIKRMFVRAEHRGKGYGKVILQELVNLTKEKHFDKLLLETGDFLTAAVSLYQSMGFRVITNYPPYEEIEESLCMTCDIA
jgi:Acetyltransferases